MHFLKNHLFQNLYFKKSFSKDKRLKQRVLGVIVPSVIFASGGIAMDFERGGQAFPWVIFSHLLRDRGGRKLSFKRFGRRAQFFSSLGPSRHFPHNHNDESADEADG